MGAGGPHLHIATIDDMAPTTLHAIIKLRIDVFVVEQQCTYAELDGLDASPTTRHLWLTTGANRPTDVLSYLRILQEPETIPMIGRIVTSPDRRRTGLGTQLMHTVLALLDDERVPEVHLNAQLYAAPWYEVFGFIPCGKTFVEDGISHVPMRRHRRAGTVEPPSSGSGLR